MGLQEMQLLGMPNAGWQQFITKLVSAATADAKNGETKGEPKKESNDLFYVSRSLFFYRNR